jgi:hypothetical protein
VVPQTRLPGHITHTKEELLLDARVDEDLATTIEGVTTLVEGVVGVAARASLSRCTSATGTRSHNPELATDIGAACSRNTNRTAPKASTGGLLPIGTITHGCVHLLPAGRTSHSFDTPGVRPLLADRRVCRHRSALFKHLAEQVRPQGQAPLESEPACRPPGLVCQAKPVSRPHPSDRCLVSQVDVPCRLLRTRNSKGQDVRHWSAVPVGPREDGEGLNWKLVTLTHTPGRLLDAESDAKQHCLYLSRDDPRCPPELVRHASSGSVDLQSVGDNTFRELRTRRYFDPIDLADPTVEVVRRGRVGKGSFRAVFSCSIGGLAVAVKEVPTRPNDERYLTYKVRELRYLRSLHHPNITACLGFQHTHEPRSQGKILSISEIGLESLDALLLRGYRRTKKWDVAPPDKRFMDVPTAAQYLKQVFRGTQPQHT